MKRLNTLIISLIVVVTTGAYGLDWTMQRATTDGAGFIDEVAYPPLTPKWSYETYSPITASPIVAQNTVFVGNHIGAFYAITAYNTTPTVLWQYDAEGRIDSTACYFNGAVYFGTRDGYLYALDSDDGSLLWSANLGTTIISSPVIYNENLYIGKGAPSNDVIVIDAVTGQTAGTVSTTQPVQSAVSFYGDDFFVTSNDGAVYSFDTTDRSSNWTPYQSVGSFERSSPVSNADGLFVSPGSDERKMYRLNINSGSKTDESNEITDPLASNRTSSPAVYNDVVYVSLCANLDAMVDLHFKLYAFDASDLTTEIWASPYDFGIITGADSFGNPTLTRNCVYTPSFDGKILAFAQSDGSSLYSNSISLSSIESQAVVSNGWVFMGLQEGTLKAFKAASIVSIVSPRNNEVIQSTTTVIGTITGSLIGDNLSSYMLSYGQGASPGSWTNIVSKSAAIDQTSIIAWDPSALTDGTYTLKLSATTSPASSLDLTSQVLITVNLPPEPPAGVSLTEASNAYTLNWTISVDDGNNNNDVTKYYIYRSTQSGSFSSLFDSVASGVNSYVDSTIIPNTQYYYVVRAYDGLQESGNSNQVQNVVTTQTEWEEITVSAGGEVALPDGTKVTFSPGTFDEDVFVQISVKQQGEYTDPGNTLLMNGTNIVKEFNVLTGAQLNALTCLSEQEQATRINQYSSSIVFKKAATIRMTYSVNEITGLDPNKLSIATWNNTVLQWQINNTSVVDTTAQYVEVQVTHFSLFRIVENPWVKIVSATGGSAQLLDGTKATAQANAFAEDVWVYIKALSNDEYNNAGLGSQYSSAGIVRRFYIMTDTQMSGITSIAAADLSSQIQTYSSSLSFDDLVTVRMPYTASDIAGSNPQKLRILWYDENAIQWKIVNTSSPDPDNLVVQARVSRFHDFQLAAFLPYGDLLEEDKVYTYPNPATGDTLTFKYFTGDDAFITVDVFNVAGEKVAHLAGQGQAGLVNTIEWDIKRYASGIYLYIMEAKQMNGNSKKKIIKKLAIIH